MEAYRLSLDAFEGPLDLLLHLIVTQEIDIHQISLARITDQYLLFLQDSIAAHMEVASEFIVMAATLIEIKAKSLLPQRRQDSDEGFDEDGDGLDEERALARRLFEYRSFKEAAEALRSMEQRRAEWIGRMPLGLEGYRIEPSVADRLGPVQLADLLASLQVALRRTRPAQDVQIAHGRETVPQRMRSIERRLRQSGATFSELLERAADRGEIVTVFLAVLELIRLRRVACEQTVHCGELWITLRDRPDPE